MNNRKRAQELLDALSHFDIYEDRKPQVFRSPTGELLKQNEVNAEAIETASALKKERIDSVAEAKAELLKVAEGKSNAQTKTFQLRNIEYRLKSANVLTPQERVSFINALRDIESNGKTIVITSIDIKKATDKAHLRQALNLKQYLPSESILVPLETTGPQYQETSGGDFSRIQPEAPSTPDLPKASMDINPIAGEAMKLPINKAADLLVKKGIERIATAATVGTAVAGPVGTVAGTVGAEVLSWLKTHSKEFLVATGAIIGVFGGLAIGVSPVLGAGIGAGGGYLAGSGVNGVTSSLSNIGNFLSGAAGGLGTLVIGNIIIPFIIIIVTIPVVVALILFVINSGAYITPQGHGGETAPGIVISPYIDISKVASPPGPFENGDAKLKAPIKYTVTVKAKQGTLTNIHFENTCQIKMESAGPACTAPLPDTIPDSITETDPFVFEYTKDFSDPTIIDAYITDSFTVVADSPKQTGAKAMVTATLKIGKPKDECPSGWAILPESGENHLNVLEGSFTKGGTHDVIEATDITASIGHTVTARHSGTVESIPEESGGNYGANVRIHSNCNGQNIMTIYGHFSQIGVRTGDTVTSGQTIGLSGDTGMGGAHLHYEFSPPGIIKMEPPYLPKAIPRGCYGNCNVQVP